MTPKNILNFWFEKIDSSFWWKKDDDFDTQILEKFSDIHHRASQSELFDWRETAQGRLAEIIILDQFSRNMFRDSPKAFAQDPLALALSQAAVSVGADQLLSPKERSFLYMPYMHSESLKVHDEAVKLFVDNGVQATVDFEMKHRQIIEKFGRYPHRNEVLGRKSTNAELQFLKLPNSSF